MGMHPILRLAPRKFPQFCCILERSHLKLLFRSWLGAVSCSDCKTLATAAVYNHLVLKTIKGSLIDY